MNSKEKLYDLLITHDTVSRSILNKNGITNEDIEKFELDDIIIKEKSNVLLNKNHTFKIKSLKKLYEFAKELDNAKSLLYYVYLFNHNYKNKEIYYKVIYYYFKNKDYQNTYLIIKEMINSNDQLIKKDGLYFLVLLSNIITLDENDINTIKSLTINDIKLQNNYDLNVVRSSILKNDYTTAFNYINSYVENYDKSNNIERILIFDILNADNKLKKELIKLAKEKQYERIITILESINSKTRLSIDNKYSLTLCKIIILYKNGDILEDDYNNHALTYYQAINNGSYLKAYDLCELYIEKHNINKDNFLNYYLLKDLKELINNNKEILNTITYLKDIIIKNKDDLFNEYLENNNLKKYGSLIKDTIKISLLSNDDKLLIKIIRNLNEHKPIHICNTFIPYFENAINNNEILKAKLYYNILKQNKHLIISLADEEEINDLLEKYHTLYDIDASGELEKVSMLINNLNAIDRTCDMYYLNKRERITVYQITSKRFLKKGKIETAKRLVKKLNKELVI